MPMADAVCTILNCTVYCESCAIGLCTMNDLVQVCTIIVRMHMCIYIYICVNIRTVLLGLASCFLQSFA